MFRKLRSTAKEWILKCVPYFLKNKTTSVIVWFMGCYDLWLSWPRTGLTNFWHACPKRHAEKFPWQAAFTAVPFFFILPDQSLYTVNNMCTYTHTCVQTVYELPLLPNINASETFLHKSGAVRSVDWIFIIKAPARLWLGDYVTLGKTFYNRLLEQEVAATPVTSTCSSLSHFSRKPLLEIWHNNYNKH